MQKEFLIFFFCTVRVSAMLMSSPIFSVKQVPNLFKAGFSMLLGGIISSIISLQNVILPSNNIDFVIVIFKEIIVGVSIGFTATLIFNAVRTSGQLIDFQAGFAMAQYYDPSTSSISTPFERFFNWFAIVIFLAFNFHHVIISAVIRSFEVVPVGVCHINPLSFKVIMSVFSKGFAIALQFAAPIIIVLFVTDFTLGLISRAVPQINVFILGMPIKFMLAMLAIAAILPGLSKVYVKAFEGMSTDLMKLLKAFPLLFISRTDDKTEEPTYKRLDDAKKKGQVPKSADLNSAMTLMAACAVLILYGDKIFYNGIPLITECLNTIKKNPINMENTPTIYIYIFKNILIAALPIMLTVMVVGIVSNIGQSGFILTNEPLKPKLERINPAEGFKRFFNKRTLAQLLKSILKIALLSYVAVGFLKGKIFDIMKTSDLNIDGIFPFVKELLDSQLVKFVTVMLIIGFADYIFQKRQYKKEMRMTKQEIKEEYKESEGDPLIKSRIRQRQREMAMHRMMHEVPKATVVVTNPTHFAVALKYDKDVNSAPKVVAKGSDIIAQRIKEIAKENNVPIVENKPLARQLFAKVELDEDVPIELYQAVAEIIAYVYSLKKM